jgi:hypothetical protein
MPVPVPRGGLPFRKDLIPLVFAVASGCAFGATYIYRVRY